MEINCCGISSLPAIFVWKLIIIKNYIFSVMVPDWAVYWWFFQAALVHAYVESPQVAGSQSVLVHIVGAAPGSASIVATLRRLCFELRRQFCIDTEIPEDYK